MDDRKLLQESNLTRT